MNNIDLIVLFGSLVFIVIYGSLKTRKNTNLNDYLKGNNQTKWPTIGLSVLATQASAITFMSIPGQAYENGMGFVQNYLGLPIALIIISAFFIPIYYKLNVFTAYEFLEHRFDLKTRLLASFIFLLQRGLATGLTIYAPAIVLSTILGWNLNITIVLFGVFVTIYTVIGGTKAVNLTQKWQLLIIFSGMITAFFMIIYQFPASVGFSEALDIAGNFGKLKAIDFSFDLSKRYTFWSGIFGGCFLALSYFGTDNSQVQRYLGGSSTTESRMGLIFNAFIKIPMQFFILLLGVMVFVFYQFQKPPVFFNQTAYNLALDSKQGPALKVLESEFALNHSSKKAVLLSMSHEIDKDSKHYVQLTETAIGLENQNTQIRNKVKAILKETDGKTEKDYDFIFITFVMNYLPHGLIGLLIAVIFASAMSSKSGELNALASCTMIDFYCRIWKKEATDKHYVKMTRLFTLSWGVIAIMFAIFASLLENLIEAINILGSIFYGTILGIFLVAFFFKNVRANGVFVAAITAQTIVIVFHFLNVYGVINIGYLWYNAIGCILVVAIALASIVLNKKEAAV